EGLQRLFVGGREVFGGADIVLRHLGGYPGDVLLGCGGAPGGPGHLPVSWPVGQNAPPADISVAVRRRDERQNTLAEKPTVVRQMVAVPASSRQRSMRVCPASLWSFEKGWSLAR